MENECIFCKIVKGEIPTEKIYETENFIVIKDKFPRTKGHSLIISKKHFENLLDFPNILGNELVQTAKETYIKIANETKSEGFNLMQNNFKAAGQVINHIHFHIIPRKDKDGIKL